MLVQNLKIGEWYFNVDNGKSPYNLVWLDQEYQTAYYSNPTPDTCLSLPCNLWNMNADELKCSIHDFANFTYGFVRTGSEYPPNVPFPRRDSYFNFRVSNNFIKFTHFFPDHFSYLFINYYNANLKEFTGKVKKIVRKDTPLFNHPSSQFISNSAFVFTELYFLSDKARTNNLLKGKSPVHLSLFFISPYFTDELPF